MSQTDALIWILKKNIKKGLLHWILYNHYQDNPESVFQDHFKKKIILILLKKNSQLYESIIDNSKLYILKVYNLSW